MHDGSTRWYGHAHNSGIDSYDVGLSAILSGSAGASLAFSHYGQGTSHSSHDWDAHQPAHELVTNEFGYFLDGNGRLASSVEYSSDFGSALRQWAGH